MFEINSLMYQHLVLSGFGLGLTAVAAFVAWRRGFFTVPNENKGFSYSRISLKEVLYAFLIFVGIALIIIPGLVYGWFAWQTGSFPQGDSIHLSPTAESTVSIITILVTASCFTFYLVNFLPLQKRNVIFGFHAFDPKRWFTDIKIGALTWFLCYPFVLTISNALIAIALLFFEKEQIDQVAVRQLKLSMVNPVIFMTLSVLIATVIPALEEILFRGFLQSWIRQRLGRVHAIIITSLIFAFFHFSKSQGLANLELSASLFILSCFLGYLFERQQSILAPIGLHSAFNSISILMIVYGK